MKLVLQRVTSAEVKVAGKTVGKIDKGLFVLVGVAKGDTKDMAEKLSDKLAKLRIMADENDKMNLNITDVDGKILAVSQFTLNADTSGGNRPSFINSEEPKRALEIFNHFVETLRSKKITVETGKFGSYMVIDAKLDGPVTIVIGSQ